MESHELESVVAAILTAGSLSAPGYHSVPAAVSLYRAIIEELRKTGGPSTPMQRPG